MFEHSNDAILILDKDTACIIKANAPALQILGYSLSFLQKSNFSDFIISENLEEWNSFLLLTSPHTCSIFESEILNKSQEFIHIEIKAIYVNPPNNKEHYLLIIKSIEPKNKDICKLQQRLQFYETILMQMPTEFAVLNAKWQYLFINHNSIKDDIFREWMIGKTDYDFCRYRNKPYTLAENRHKQYEEVARTKKGKEWVDEHLTKEGNKKYVLRKLYPYFEDGELSMNFGFGIDITKMIEVEQEQELIIKAMTQQNEELTQFAYITTHDLKEPLRNISSFTNLLQRRYKAQFSEEAHEFMDFIVGNAKRMNDLLIDLKSYVTIDKSNFHKESLDANVIVENAIANLHWLVVEKNVSIVYDQLPNIKGYSTYLIQLFQNLISNAIKFCNTTPSIKIKCTEKSKYYLFEVVDNGIGILPEFQDRIFKIFNRLDKQNYEGTGMGLAICKKMVQLHGGSISVYSDGNNGSTFSFEIEK